MFFEREKAAFGDDQMVEQRMPMSSPARLSLRVASLSSGEGLQSPEGWLWATMRAAAGEIRRGEDLAGMDQAGRQRADGDRLMVDQLAARIEVER